MHLIVPRWLGLLKPSTIHTSPFPLSKKMRDLDYRNATDIGPSQYSIE